MKKILLVIAMLIIAAPVLATVSVTATDKGSGVVEVKYNCSAAEKVRAFALDITVDNGLTISNIRDYNAGESKVPGGGYGIFPGKFAEYINASGPNWADTNYNPIAPTGDPNAKSGLGTGAITVELGTLYVDPNSPGTSGLLFRLDVNSNGAHDGNLLIALNGTRGGIVLEDTNLAPSPVLTGTKVTFPVTSPCTGVPAVAPCASMTDVNNAITGAGLTVGTITYEVNCACPYGTVLRVTTTGCIPALSPVNYVVSSGVSIPYKVGVLKATAESAWTGQGFTLGTATAVVNCAQVGNIVSQDTGCVSLPHTVNYTYGIAATVPNEVNMPLAAAQAAITAAGLSIGNVTYEPNGLLPAGNVDRTNPVAGTVTCSAVDLVVDTNCLYAGRVFSLYGTVTFTVTAAQVGYWNALGQPNCWCCTSQKRGNGVYTGSTATKTDALDLAGVKNAANWTKTDSAAANVCLDFNLSNKIDALDLAVVKNANNWTKVTGAGPPCQ